MQKKLIVHAVCRDKFTTGYINFMTISMPEYEHLFIVPSGSFEVNAVDGANVVFINRMKEWRTNKTVKAALGRADKIIVSGVFGVERGLAIFCPQYLKKTYLHFWGNDFYQLRTPAKDIKNKIYQWIKKYCIKHCKAWITLIAEDYDELVKIIGTEKKHFIAPMPFDPTNKDDLKWTYVEKEPEALCRIIVGNSATDTNKHFEAFELLSHLKNEQIEILCPLSYGDMEYGERVKKEGRRIFGDKFRAVTEYMSLDEYTGLLSTCDIGVFANDRQQARGNIYRLLGMGKKVYMRSGTSMWNNMNGVYAIFDMALIQNADINELKEFDPESKEKNIALRRDGIMNRPIRQKARWTSVFDD